MSRLEWLTSLENGKRTVAILILGIMTVFSMWLKSEYNRGVEKERHELQESQYKETLIKRTDAFNEVYRQLLIDCNERVERDLREQLERSQSTLNKTNKIVEKNEQLIKKVHVPKP